MVLLSLKVELVRWCKFLHSWPPTPSVARLKLRSKIEAVDVLAHNSQVACHEMMLGGHWCTSCRRVFSGFNDLAPKADA